MSAPTERHMETARDIARKFAVFTDKQRWGSLHVENEETLYRDFIAPALANAEREGERKGMERAAAIAFTRFDLRYDDRMRRAGALISDSIRNDAAILSQAGEG